MKEHGGETSEVGESGVCLKSYEDSEAVGEQLCVVSKGEQRLGMTREGLWHQATRAKPPSS